MRVTSYDQIIDSWSVNLLREECDDMEKLNCFDNYWLGLNDLPTCSVEQYILDCFDFYLADQFPNAVGFEWWTHHFVEDNRMLAFHVDCDEHIRYEKRKIVTPLLSTVTYLTHHPSPTVILNVCQNGDLENELAPTMPDEVVYSVPGEGKFLTFNSRYMHGVTVGSAGRWTLMYNIWDYKPEKLQRCNYSSSPTSSHFYKCEALQPVTYLGPTRCCKINYYDVQYDIRYPIRTDLHDTWLVTQ
jgi:hypothetical protein